MITVQLSGGPMDGQLRAVPDKVQTVTVWFGDTPPAKALGFYGPSESAPDGVWKWNGLYD